MDYATAIREGCKILPNKLRWCYDETTKSACVNFAALVGLTGVEKAIQIGMRNDRDGNTRGMLDYLEKNLPEAKHLVKLPCSCVPGHIASLVVVAMHLNDHHKKWTREKIADWIESLG